MTDKKVNIGILGAMDSEVEALIAKLENKYEEVISGIKFNIGSLYGKRVAVAKCGIGKAIPRPQSLQTTSSEATAA